MFTTQQKIEIATLVSEKMGEKKLSQPRAGNQIGMSAAYVNHIVNKKLDLFDTISDGLWRLAAKWAGYKFGTWGTYESDNLDKIFNLCHEAQEGCRFMAIIGDTGDGKTKGLTFYANHKTTTNTYYILCVKTMGRKDFLNAILKSIGIEYEGSIHGRLYTIVEYLRMNNNCLLQFDDVGKLPENCLSIIQQIYDEAEGMVGIIIAGLTAFKKQFFKLALKDKPGYRELKRRIAYWMLLNKISKQFIVKVATQFGITDEPAIKYITDNAPDYGTFKEMMENYVTAAEKNPTLTQRERLAGIHLGTKEVDEVLTVRKAA